MEDHLQKLREERIAREKARIAKLREINLKKYSKNGFQPLQNSTSTVSIPNKPKLNVIASTKSKSDTNCIAQEKNAVTNHLKRPIAAPVTKNATIKDTLSKKIITANHSKSTNKSNNKNVKDSAKLNKEKQHDVPKAAEKNRDKVREIIIEKLVSKEIPNCTNETSNETTTNGGSNDNPSVDTNSESQKPLKPKHVNKNINGTKNSDKNNIKTHTAISKVDNKQKKIVNTKKTNVPVSKQNSIPTKESVFERLYKPKLVHKQSIDNVTRLKTDPAYLKRIIKNSEMITNQRHTIFEQKTTVRRSVSAIHYKRITKSEINNCVHKWASIGNNIDKEHLQDINEYESIPEEKVISAVKSERKRVKFQTPVPKSLNTPKPEELRQKLQNWLQKRGKRMDSYHHLQCFGINHLSNDIKSFAWEPPNFNDDDENKENIALDHDSDNESYLENNNGKGSLDERNHLDLAEQKWRRASNITETSDINETFDNTLTPGDSMHHIDELVLGALNDLTELLREGFEWEQCARWLRAIRERFNSVTHTAPYWECRAALEERRGDLHATVQCLEQAMAKGTEQSIVEANLDSLLDKFMHLKISPNGGPKQVNPKLVDVKNVFKSTIIRFAVQQAKLSQSAGTPKFTVTPVRRSHRLSRTRTPLRVCATVHQARELGAEFKPNKALVDSP